MPLVLMHGIRTCRTLEWIPVLWYWCCCQRSARLRMRVNFPSIQISWMTLLLKWVNWITQLQKVPFTTDHITKMLKYSMLIQVNYNQNKIMILILCREWRVLMASLSNNRFVLYQCIHSVASVQILGCVVIFRSPQCPLSKTQVEDRGSSSCWNSDLQS